MSRSSRRKKRRARAARVGHGRGRGQRMIILNPPDASFDEINARIMLCLPSPALESLRGKWKNPLCMIDAPPQEQVKT